jgi:hypothetical protein
MKELAQPLVTVIGIIVGAAVSIYQVKRAVGHKRTSLHQGLETLKLARELQIPAKALEIEITQRLAKLEPDYQSPESHITGPVVLQSVVGIVLAIGFGYWTYYLSRNGFSWWSVLTGLFAFGCFMQPFVAFSEQQRRDEFTTSDSGKPKVTTN